MPEENQNLENAILKTMAFFDIFDYPLTLVEIYKWLYQPDRDYQLSDLVQGLNFLNSKDIISQKHGFYFFKGQESIIHTRLERYQYAERKFKIALKTVRWLRWLVFIKMIGVCNNASYNNATEESDIDFFIIVKQGRLWWSRLIITLAASLLGVRRHDKKITDRICLSFYITDNHLNLSDVALKPVDPYLVYWFTILAPIFNQDFYQKFMKANDWLKSYLPNFCRTILTERRRVEDNKYIRFSRHFDELVLSSFFGVWLEKLAKFIQLKKMRKNISSVANQSDSKVIISDSMLKFHEADKREEYRNLWQEKLNELGVS